MVDSFNEYLFEYTSKIPIKEIEKAVNEQVKEEKDIDKVVSPYTREPKKHSMKFYTIIYILIIIVTILLLLWSFKQITVNKQTTDEISYVE